MNLMRQKLQLEQVGMMQNLIEWLIPAVLDFLSENTQYTTIYSENYLFYVSNEHNNAHTSFPEQNLIFYRNRF